MGFLSAVIIANGNDLTALDISAAAIEECRKRFGDKATFLEADIVTFKHEKRFAYAFINEVLDQIPDDVGALASVYALLEPGGKLILSSTVSEERFIDATVHRYDVDELRGKVQSVGFEIAAAEKYGGMLSYVSAVLSKRFRIPKPVLSLVRKIPFYKQLVMMDSKLAAKGDRILLVCEKPRRG